MCRAASARAAPLLIRGVMCDSDISTRISSGACRCGADVCASDAPEINPRRTTNPSHIDSDLMRGVPVLLAVGRPRQGPHPTPNARLVGVEAVDGRPIAGLDANEAGMLAGCGP